MIAVGKMFTNINFQENEVMPLLYGSFNCQPSLTNIHLVVYADPYSHGEPLM